MKKIILTSLSLFTLMSCSTLRGPASSAQVKIVSPDPQRIRQCLQSIANDPASPPVLDDYFQKMGTKNIFAAGCYFGDEDYKAFDRYFFITDEGLKTLSFPKYFYETGGDTAELPRNVIHFKDNTEDYLLLIGLVGDPTVFPQKDIAKISERTGDKVTKIQTTYIKKYEDWLKNQGKSSAINLTLADAEQTTFFGSCIEDKVKGFLRDYFRNKFSGNFIPYNTMVADYNKFESLEVDRRELYKLSWEEKKAEILNDVSKNHPICNDVIDPELVKKHFEDSWSDRERLYTAIHERFYGNK